MIASSNSKPRWGAHSFMGPRGLAGLSLVALSLTAPGELWAAPQYVRLSFTDDSHTTMTVAWNTAADVAGEVRYGTSPGNLTQTATGISNLGPGPMGYIHEVTLTGLQPDTLYYYQAGETNDGYSPEYSFVTGPTPHQECGEFDFLFLGDNRPDGTLGGGENYDQILQQAEAHNAAFLLNGGDMVIDGDQLDQWANYLAYSESSSAFMPFMTAIGNHDNGPGEGDSAYYNQLFALPRSTGTYGSNTEDYYYFLYGNAIVVSLSTDTFKGGSTPFQNQADWLDEVLTAHPQTWKIVFLHKPIYTSEVVFSISHEPNEEGQNAAFVSVFDAHHVDVVLTSHNHWYERYEPSACGNQSNPGSDMPCPVGGDPANGTVYYVSGGAGAFTIPAWLNFTPPAGQVKCLDNHHYMLFQVEDTKLTIDTWGAFPQANQIIDTLEIQKQSTVDCENVGPGGAGGGGASSSGVGGSSSGTGGSTSSGTGGSTTSSGAGANGTTPAGDAAETGGCGCATKAPARPTWLALAAAGLGLGWWRRRRRPPR